MKIALIQTHLQWNDPKSNVAHLEALVRDAENRGASLIILPEMFTTGFSLPIDEAALHAADVGRSFLERIAKEKKIWVCGSLPEEVQGSWKRPQNTLFVYGPEGIVGSYRKTHLFSLSGEDKRYHPGENSLTLYLDSLRISFFICYDLRFPLLFSALAEKSDVFVCVANWPARRSNHWKTLTAARAIENQAYMIAVNCVGTIGELDYSGDSVAIAPDGEVLCDCKDASGVFIVEIDKSRVRDYRKTFPLLSDRRPELYQKLSGQITIK